ncbi:hypothetical protein BU015_12565 [Staphylococcus simulans]|nr:hypothetical protein BU015_12565 [Staphylococcus simulans]
MTKTTKLRKRYELQCQIGAEGYDKSVCDNECQSKAEKFRCAKEGIRNGNDYRVVELTETIVYPKPKKRKVKK